jgi:hypothetical protein
LTIEINKALPLLKNLLAEVGMWIASDLNSVS